MAKGSQELEREFIETARAKTGHDVPEWMEIIKQTGLNKPNAIIKWLKEQHKLNHLQANTLAGIFLNDGKPVYDYAVLSKQVFAGKDEALALYQRLEKAIRDHLPEVECIPTRSYISIEGKRVFACATPTAKTLRIGLDLGDTPFGDYVQKAKGLGAMPNISHMIELRGADDLRAELVDYLRRAYANAHKK